MVKRKKKKTRRAARAGGARALGLKWEADALLKKVF